MADIVERLRLFVPHCEDPNDYLEDELLFLKAADEIERLREALRDIAEIDPERWDVITCIVHARTALKEKK